MKKQRIKGITLISLVITMIILLILAGISLTMVLRDNGIVARAKEAKNKSDQAQKNETTQIQEINSDAGIELYATRKKEESRYYRPYVPDQFIYLEGTWENGLVIKDRTNGNEFVWVPIDGNEIKYERNIWDGLGSLLEDGSTSTADHEYYEEDAQEMTRQKESVVKYGGFYIARYEAGKGTDLDGKPIIGVDEADLNVAGYPVSKPNQEVWNCINAINAKNNAIRMYEGQKDFTSYLTSSYAWDATLTFFMKKGGKTLSEIAANSTQWANYANSAFSFKGGYSLDKGTTYHQTDTEITKESGTIVLLKTGVHMEPGYRNEVCHLFDFAGNVYEWTTEKSMGGIRTIDRGGGLEQIDSAAAYRDQGGTDGLATWLGYRVMLYIK